MAEEKSFFEKNMETWEKWTSTYMDTMAQAMDRTMQQSASFKEQMDKAVASAVGTQMDAMLGALKSLERQVETLSEKIDDMLKVED
jgi:hypothetical protein